VGRVALDASVLLAILQSSDAHHSQARALLEGHESDTRYAIGASVYAEILVRAHRRRKVPATDDFLVALGVDVIPIDRELARRAAALRATGTPRLTLADALALAVALAPEPPIPFVTFDERLARRYQAEARTALGPG
jgi:predicted nucleic acid-binding protein